MRFQFKNIKCITKSKDKVPYFPSIENMLMPRYKNIIINTLL